MVADGDERLKARATGVMMAVGGVGMLVYLLAGPVSGSRKVIWALSMAGPMLVWFGAGLAVVPLPESKFQELEGGDLGMWFGGLPLFWKVWAPLTLVVMFTGLVWGALATG
jgi:hypothetical protein